MGLRLPWNVGSWGTVKWIRRRLGWKIGLLLSVVLLFVMMVLSVGDYLWQRRVFLDDLSGHTTEEAWTVATLLQGVETPVEQQRLLTALVRTLNQVGGRTRDHELFILDARGIVVAATLENLLGQPMDSAPIRRVLNGEAQSATGVMRHDDHLSFYSVVPFYAEEGASTSPIGAVHVAEPLQPIQAHLRQFLTQRLLFLGLVTGLLIVLVNLLISRTVSVPLNSLARRMERVHHGDLETHVPVRTSDELGQIGDAFNAMIQAVRTSQQAIERERRRLALLYDISRRLANAADWEEVVRLLVRIPGEVVEAVGCLFASFDERTGRFALEGAWGLEEELLVDLELHLRKLDHHLPCLTCQPRMARFGDHCPLLLPHFEGRSNIRSILCLHLAQGEQTVGFLNVYLPTSNPPPPDKVQLLNTIAAEMAAVVAAAQLRARELAMLSSLEQAFRSPVDVRELLEQILEQVREACRVAQGAVFLRDEETQRLQPVAFQGIGIDKLQALHPLADRSLAQRAPVVIDEAQHTSHPDGPVSIVAIPLALEDTALGVLLLADPRPQAFTQRQITLLTTIANQTALIVRNSQLYSRLEGQAILEERNRLAREIHDGLVQTLGYLKLQLSRMHNWALRGEIERLQAEIANLREAVEEAYAEARDAITGLRIGFNSGDTLEHILAEYAQGFSARYQLPIELIVEGDSLSLPSTTMLQLLRIVQEGLTNVRKHAQASQAWIVVRYEPDVLTLLIRDDGRGMDPAVIDQIEFRGLQFMRERAEGLGGELAILPCHPRGTEVRVTIPLRRKDRWGVRPETTQALPLSDEVALTDVPATFVPLSQGDAYETDSRLDR